MKFTNLKLYRQCANLTAIEVCSHLKIDTARLSRLENEWLVPREAELKKLAELYGVSVKTLTKPNKVLK